MQSSLYQSKKEKEFIPKKTGHLTPEEHDLFSWLIEEYRQGKKSMDLNSVIIDYLQPVEILESHRQNALFLLKHLVSEGYLKEHYSGFQNPGYTLEGIWRSLAE